MPGGLSICSYGAVRSAHDPDLAFQYLRTTNDGRTPDDVLRALAHGMCEIEQTVRELGKINGAVIVTSVEENKLREKAAIPIAGKSGPIIRFPHRYVLSHHRDRGAGFDAARIIRGRTARRAG